LGSPAFAKAFGWHAKKTKRRLSAGALAVYAPKLTAGTSA